MKIESYTDLLCVTREILMPKQFAEPTVVDPVDLFAGDDDEWEDDFEPTTLAFEPEGESTKITESKRLEAEAFLNRFLDGLPADLATKLRSYNDSYISPAEQITVVNHLRTIINSHDNHIDEKTVLAKLRADYADTFFAHAFVKDMVKTHLRQLEASSLSVDEIHLATEGGGAGAEGVDSPEEDWVNADALLEKLLSRYESSPSCKTLKHQLETLSAPKETSEERHFTRYAICAKRYRHLSLTKHPETRTVSTTYSLTVTEQQEIKAEIQSQLGKMAMNTANFKPDHLTAFIYTSSHSDDALMDLVLGKILNTLQMGVLRKERACLHTAFLEVKKTYEMANVATQKALDLQVAEQARQKEAEEARAQAQYHTKMNQIGAEIKEKLGISSSAEWTETAHRWHRAENQRRIQDLSDRIGALATCFIEVKKAVFDWLMSSRNSLQSVEKLLDLFAGKPSAEWGMPLLQYLSEKGVLHRDKVVDLLANPELLGLPVLQKAPMDARFAVLFDNVANMRKFFDSPIHIEEVQQFLSNFKSRDFQVGWSCGYRCCDYGEPWLTARTGLADAVGANDQLTHVASMIREIFIFHKSPEYSRRIKYALGVLLFATNGGVEQPLATRPIWLKLLEAASTDPENAHRLAHAIRLFATTKRQFLPDATLNVFAGILLNADKHALPLAYKLAKSTGRTVWADALAAVEAGRKIIAEVRKTWSEDPVPPYIVANFKRLIESRSRWVDSSEARFPDELGAKLDNQSCPTLDLMALNDRAAPEEPATGAGGSRGVAPGF